MLRMVPRSASAREIKGFPSATCCSGRTPRLRARDRSARAIRPTNIRTGVDGQQRLTSLYAVFRGKKVLDSDYRERARNPESPSAESLEVQSACSQLPGRRGANDFFLAKGDGMFYICSRHAAENARMSNPGVAKRDAKRPGRRSGAETAIAPIAPEKAPEGIEKAGFTPGNGSVNRPYMASKVAR